jgi:DUF1365 family protein
VFYLLVDVEELAVPQKTSTRPWCLSLDRFNLFSVHQKDYLDKGSEDLKSQITTALAGVDIGEVPARVMLLTMPRVLGYAFNPINIFYCLDVDDSIMAILYEVNNTFGERHSYAFQIGQGQPGPSKQLSPHQADKNFHVSPFFPVEGKYRFRQSPPDDTLALSISYRDRDDRPLLSATLSGKRAKLTARTLAGLFFRIPFMTLKVTSAIHLQAVRLRMKGLVFWHKPSPPSHAVTGPTPLKQ